MSKKSFIHDNFILNNKQAEKFYHDYAESLPIVDFHCHLDPSEILADHSYKNMTEIWLGGDHYKWRAMRWNGVPETFISGNGDDREKFNRWAEVVPYTLGNPLYHWSHMELKRYFGIDELLSPATADMIWDETKSLLQTPDFTCRNLIKRSKVELVGTTDDALSDLAAHKSIRETNAMPGCTVVPTFRPDRFLHPQKPSFKGAVDEFSSMLGKDIRTFADLMDALKDRVDYFVEQGCTITDHGLEAYHFRRGTETELNDAFRRFYNDEPTTVEDLAMWQTEFLCAMAPQYVKHDLAVQIHFGALRNNNTPMFEAVGPDSGFDSIGSAADIESLSSLLNAWRTVNAMPRTILYNLNPADNAAIATLCGNFVDAEIPGKVQWGAAWWFMDQKPGMEEHLRMLSSLCIMRRFVGMVTDSRSYLSYTRHEYFRRVLCNTFGEWWEQGILPHDEALIGEMIRDMCYRNAHKYMGLDVK